MEAGLQDQIIVDSAGTGDWHIGDPPDARSVEVAEGKGYDMSKIFARQICTEDFDKFDYILAMDEENYNNIQKVKLDIKSNLLHLFLSFNKAAGRLDVPDPYYGAGGGFDHVLELIEGASDGLLNHIRQRLNGVPCR